MAEYRLKTPKIIENSVVRAYRKVEDTVVGAYQKIEDRFVEAYLERTDRADNTSASDGAGTPQNR